MSGLYLSVAEVTAGADDKPTAFSWAKTRPAWRKDVDDAAWEDEDEVDWCIHRRDGRGNIRPDAATDKYSTPISIPLDGETESMPPRQQRMRQISQQM